MSKSDDLISRQAVLDYIDNMPSELTADGRRMIRRIRLTEYIRDSLPSAQPEIVLCKECKHWEYDVIFADGWCRGKQQGNPEWFCADAERRTDE